MLPYEECPTSLSCYPLDAWQFIDWRAISVAACFWIAAMTIAYFHGEKGEVKQLFLGAFKGTIVTLAAIALFLLGLLVYSPWQRYQALKEHTLKTVGEKDTTIETQKKTIEDLQLKLKEQPKVVYHEKQISRDRSAEVEKLLADRENRKAIRDQISKFIDEGHVLRFALLVKDERPDIIEKAEAWNNKTANYLRSIELSYASRFVAATGFTLSYRNTAESHQVVVNNLRYKLDVLAVLLGELRD